MLINDEIKNSSVRDEAVKGKFYPEDKSATYDLVKSYVNDNVELKPNVHGLIVPHAGYIYSGPCAGKAYELIQKKFDNIILLGPNHTVYIEDAYIDNNNYWKIFDEYFKIEKIDGVDSNSEPHIKEHSLEVQMPFLRNIQESFSITPIVVGQLTQARVEELANIISSKLTEKTLLIISSDLSHFNSLEEANYIDEESIKNIVDLNSTSAIDACGINPIRILKEICKIKKWEISFLTHSTSSSSSEDDSNVVGYGSFWF